MSRGFVIAGTDTDVGKTVFAAALAGALDASYWKPIQCGPGDDGRSDAETVERLSGLPPQRILAEAYRFSKPLSPHRAAELDNIGIDAAKLIPPATDGPLVIELAGGLMVPVTRHVLQTDLLVKWDIPVILVARTALGTINHSLLSLFALRMREVPIHGVVFTGEANEDSERTICEISGIRHLGRLPRLVPLDAVSLRAAFLERFRLQDFL